MIHRELTQNIYKQIFLEEFKEPQKQKRFYGEKYLRVSFKNQCQTSALKFSREVGIYHVVEFEKVRGYLYIKELEEVFEGYNFYFAGEKEDLKRHFAKLILGLISINNKLSKKVKKTKWTSTRFIQIQRFFWGYRPYLKCRISKESP